MAEPRDRATKSEGTEGQQLASQQQAPTEEWIYSYNSNTGELLKIERHASGERKELSQEEYAAVLGYEPSAQVDEATMLQQAAWEAGYTQAIAEYEAALAYAAQADAAAQNESLVVQQLAYYQGLSDYAAMLG
jgi:hypothetical protein